MDCIDWIKVVFWMVMDCITEYLLDIHRIPCVDAKNIILVIENALRQE